MQQNPSWAVNTRSDIQQIPLVLPNVFISLLTQVCHWSQVTWILCTCPNAVYLRPIPAYTSIYLHYSHSAWELPCWTEKKFSDSAGQMTELSTCTPLIVFWRIKNIHRINQFYITHVGQHHRLCSSSTMYIMYQADLVKVNGKVHPRTGHKGPARE
jgi:hypothetical protein